ncbi:leucyl/phenylalanyl-tRNA--protein transferase [Spongiibacter sp. KMU-158]|uniref:Leucyl/phenylalanyl-tRNA--protein transferase n=1 Tax=Spongiibacter pelagi TaxID=2760804 RepID=A0A927C4F9_9GAMM|nr:leucyl/phenylalanyl-tRNA--protein transferase [Spongiibacter pelagi]MBD2859255.1 leucyl/phenylalanyl-tRNA--protein transferase [Spongiibacter pelagi]
MSDQPIDIPWLSADGGAFPDIDTALPEPNGLLAVGGDLSPSRLLDAYQHGIFPWYEQGQPILWWSPEPRAVLFPERIHISRSLRKQLRQDAFTIRFDSAFDAVIESCSELTQKREGTWITTAMKRAYKQMHQLGWAHSIEVWQEERLVGGLYGLAIGNIFFGESMFSRAPSASKIALVHLCEHLQAEGFVMIDCQVGNDYLYSMGAEDIGRPMFRRYLNDHARPELRKAQSWESMFWEVVPNKSSSD